MSTSGGCGPTGMADCPPVPGSPYNSFNPPPSTYVVNSKIMVVAVAVLFAVVVFILCLHVYAKWFWRNQASAPGAADGTLRTGSSWRRRRRIPNPNMGNNNNNINPLVVQSVGLDKAVIAALPTFEFDAGKVEGALECAVCLEEFEDGEKGRTLPKCGHHFHLDCVDMWLHSHSTCPLCRASVRPDEKGNETSALDQSGHHDPQLYPADVPVIGDVQAPFMAAMRASRRRQRSSRSSSQVLPNSLNSPTTTGDLIISEHPPTVESPQLPPASELPHDSTNQAPRETMLTISGNLGSRNQEATPVDPKVLALEYETPAEIPSNVLFWGNNNNQTQPSASQPIRAPFQVTIDIPGAGAAGGSQISGNVLMSPMARASASFRRLLSRGKSVVSPQDDGAADEGEPSSSPTRHQMPPPPPPPNAS